MTLIAYLVEIAIAVVAVWSKGSVATNEGFDLVVEVEHELLHNMNSLGFTILAQGKSGKECQEANNSHDGQMADESNSQYGSELAEKMRTREELFGSRE